MLSAKIFIFVVSAVFSISAQNNLIKGPLYRYYYHGIQDHFYTMKYSELKGGKSGWISEGIACKLLVYQYPDSIPLYRYWNGKDHFYTTNIKEIGTSVPGALGKHKYKSEGVTGYCYPDHRPGTIPLHRYYQASGIDHIYTINVNEIGTHALGQVGRYSYKDEDVACYVFPPN